MAYKSDSNTDEIELKKLSSDNEIKEGYKEKKLDRTVNFSSDIDINGNKMPKSSKNVQFSTQQFSFENEFEFEIKPNLIPNRKRYALKIKSKCYELKRKIINI